MKAKRVGTRCAACGSVGHSTPYDGIYLHSQNHSGDCTIAVINGKGVSLDLEYEVVDDEVFTRVVAEVAEAPAEVAVTCKAKPDLLFTDNGVPVVAPISGFASAESAANALFKSVGLENLGGSSGLRGWSSVSTFQRCRYLWKVKYGDVASTEAEKLPGAMALEVGTLVHLLIAIHYSKRIDAKYPLTPEKALAYLEKVPVTPGYLAEAWRLFSAYRAYWGDETWMTPLAVEHLVVSPEGTSCRWDLVFRVDQPYENMLPGVYVCNLKTSRDNGMVAQERWRNDGQILGEIDLYNRLGYEEKWGKLRGGCVRLIVKTKTPQFSCIVVVPPQSILRDHRRTLKIWSAEMDMAVATNDFRRSRAACVTQHFSMCELADHCAGGDAEREIDE